jgi:hypothetical protein
MGRGAGVTTPLPEAVPLPGGAIGCSRLAPGREVSGVVVEAVGAGVGEPVEDGVASAAPVRVLGRGDGGVPESSSGGAGRR